MVRVRNLVLAIAAATALTTEMAHALGLGEVTLQSSLNQPLIAEIELLDANSLAPGEVIPVLASLEEFNRAGIDRQYFLTDLKFTPVLRPNGKSVIQVSSSKPVREPYLNFLVEVLWPSGRLLREYTLLLDPPLYSPETAAAAAPQLPISAPVRAVEPARSAPARPAATPSSSVSTAVATQTGTEYKTSARDTLWDIAERNRRSGTVHQTMLAIQDLNPNAFIDGNINRMKSGQVLRLPDAEQISRRSQSEAIGQVAEQNAAWRQGRSGAVAGTRQLDATRRTEAGAAPSRSDSGDNLRLVAADSGKSTAGSDTGSADGGKALRDKLAVTQESLDSSRRENDELKDRLNDLQGQLEKLQRLMQLKDDQLAKLQVQLGADSQAPVANGASAQPDAAPVQSPEGQAAVEGGANGVDSAAGSVASQQEPAPAAAPAPAERPAAAKPAAKPAPAKPAAPVAEPEPKGLIDDLLSNTLLLGVVGGSALLLLLLGLMALSRRNAMKEAELQESLMADDTVDDLRIGTPTYVDIGQEQPESTSFQGSNASAPSDELTASTGDALAEADIYIAYGRFNQAAELLQNALNDEPQRSDLRLKLMEVYAELGNRDGFAREEAELREIGGATSEVEQLKYKYPAMAAMGGSAAAVAATQMDVDSFNLDDLQLDDPSVPSAGQDLDDAFDLSLEDLDIDLNDERPTAAPAGESLNFDDLTLDEPELERDPQSAASDFSFDLEEDGDSSVAQSDDLSDFSFDLESEKQAGAADNEFSLDLDDEVPAAASTAFESDELDFELAEPVASPNDELPEGFDISLDEPAFEAQPGNFADKLSEVEADLEDLSKDLEEPAPVIAADRGVADADAGADDDFDFFSDTDETTTKLDLARAYIDMGDAEGARDILDEVIAEGSDVQQQEARDMLAKLA
ncbi:tetratricopeptide repeat protein [Pseudomonas stutzeri]|uniref:Peptigoglycan-binding protein LysM n=1 Tax=Stutzerimonas stutzeri TaxID=316 RepID=A0A2N8RZ78_STUST|nr:FimV/HubP family polar landmark protein [Stutzerimonas stutzeri]MCQ4297546.1 tetratricopeptide repeat protein [Stutzerimonas stutzeri]PNF79680.1 peptigoglycan-binding protein LysM [Stutzerimonas stutzeri]